MSKYYIARIEYYSEYDDKEKISYALVAANSYKEATDKVCEDWGEDDIESISLTIFNDEDCGTVSISESMADAFIHDITEDVYCVPSEWRRRQLEENN